MAQGIQSPDEFAKQIQSQSALLAQAQQGAQSGLASQIPLTQAQLLRMTPLVQAQLQAGLAPYRQQIAGAFATAQEQFQKEAGQQLQKYQKAYAEYQRQVHEARLAQMHYSEKAHALGQTNIKTEFTPRIGQSVYQDYLRQQERPQAPQTAQQTQQTIQQRFQPVYTNGVWTGMIDTQKNISIPMQNLNPAQLLGMGYSVQYSPSLPTIESRYGFEAFSKEAQKIRQTEAQKAKVFQTIKFLNPVIASGMVFGKEVLKKAEQKGYMTARPALSVTEASQAYKGSLLGEVYRIPAEIRKFQTEKINPALQRMASYQPKTAFGKNLNLLQGKSPQLSASALLQASKLVDLGEASLWLAFSPLMELGLAKKGKASKQELVQKPEAKKVSVADIKKAISENAVRNPRENLQSLIKILDSKNPVAIETAKKLYTEILGKEATKALFADAIAQTGIKIPIPQKTSKALSNEELEKLVQEVQSAFYYVPEYSYYEQAGFGQFQSPASRVQFQTTQIVPARLSSVWAIKPSLDSLNAWQSIQATQQRQTPFITSVSALKLKQPQETKTTQATASASVQALRNLDLQAPITAPISVQIPALQQPQISPSVFERPVVPENPFFRQIPPSELVPKWPTKKRENFFFRRRPIVHKARGFDIFIKGKSKSEGVSLSLGSARALARKKLLRSLKATATIRPSGRPAEDVFFASSPRETALFRSYRVQKHRMTAPSPFLLIQRQKSRLSSIAERRQIQARKKRRISSIW